MNDTETTTRSDTDFARLIPLIQTLLRLLGVYLFVIGLAGVVEDFGEQVIRWRSGAVGVNYLLLPRFFGSVVYLAAGLYLLIGGRCLIETVFIPATDSSDPQSANPEDDTDL